MPNPTRHTHVAVRFVLVGFTIFEMLFSDAVRFLGHMNAAENKGPTSASAVRAMTDGKLAFQKGAFEESARQWERAANLFEAGKKTRDRIDALANLSVAYQALGQPCEAVRTLEVAADIAQASDNPSSVVLTKAGLGRAYTAARRLNEAERNLNEALALARSAHDENMISAIMNDTGTLLVEQGKSLEAIEQFREAAEVARRNTNALLTARALCNAGVASLLTQRYEEADRFNDSALTEIRSLPASQELALLFNRNGRTDWQLSQQRKEFADRLLTRATSSYEQALQIAKKLGDQRAETYALGYLGQIYESKREYTKASTLTDQAVFTAQQIQSPHALYRWEWQTARLQKAQGETASALESYRRTLQTLREIRSDLAVAYSARAPFRESVGPVFYEFADLLLRQAKSEKDSAMRERLLRETRNALEQLKSAELEDYFRDECVDISLAKTAEIERVGPHTAVIYIVPLADRTELLIGLPNGFEQVTLPVNAAQLTAEVLQFRFNLEKRTTHQYLKGAQQLYQWLIEPVQSILSTSQTKTLVFVPDGVLRTIPMAALHDGEHFLIEKFAVAVTPGLRLMEPNPVPRKDVHILMAGLSKSVRDFPSLPYVTEELENVDKLFKGPVLLNEAFTHESLTKEFAKTQYQIVHFASHGEFHSESEKSFLLTYDGFLTLNQLEALIQPSRFRGRPVELLGLSACQTAAGDERAALGLAGVAVKAGARSAFATLWFVNDQSTSMLVSEFYTQLKTDPNASKAEALQRAQQTLLRDRRYQHPCYWSPYLIIGNWL